MSLMHRIEALLILSDNLGNADSRKGEEVLEENIEWSEFDEVVRHFSGKSLANATAFNRILDVLLRLVLYSFLTAKATQ